MSASASIQLFPTSKQTSAPSSNFRSRTICAALNRYFARVSAGTFFHTSKYLFAASIACAACSFDASWNTPITSEGREGFVDFFFPVVTTFCPAIHIGYSCPNSDFTFANAASIRLRFSAFEKSINASFVNSGTCNFASAVAITFSFVAQPFLAALLGLSLVAQSLLTVLFRFLQQAGASAPAQSPKLEWALAPEESVSSVSPT